jgi:hypothetical protein
MVLNLVIGGRIETNGIRACARVSAVLSVLC